MSKKRKLKISKSSVVGVERPNRLDEQKPIPQWRKELFHRQPFPDNYSGGDALFLSELRKNVSAVKYSLRSAFVGASHLMCHLDAIVLYFLLFETVKNEGIHLGILAVFFIATVTFCYFIYSHVLAPRVPAIKDHLLILGTLLTFGYALTPIIRTLTTTISTDTVYALSLMFAVVSCIFHDYAIRAPIVSQPLSVSSGLSSAVFLISRLSSSNSAFLLLSAAFTLHSHWPRLRNELFAQKPNVALGLSMIFCALSLILLYTMSGPLCVIWTIAHVFVLGVCPILLIVLQSRKSTIHGPWDEAVPARSASD